MSKNLVGLWVKSLQTASMWVVNSKYYRVLSNPARGLITVEAHGHPIELPAEYFDLENPINMSEPVEKDVDEQSFFGKWLRCIISLPLNPWLTVGKWYEISESGDKDNPYKVVVDNGEAQHLKSLGLFDKTRPCSYNPNKVGEANYDYINPSHYQNYEKETWEMMLAIWGPEKFIAYCEMNSMKYRMRLGSKPGQPIERDLEKAKWYENKAKEIRQSQ